MMENLVNVLSSEEKELLDQINCDNETGNHLLGRFRSEEYWKMRDEIFVAHKTICPVERQVAMLEYMHQASDYFYYNSLPSNKKMF